MARNMRDAVTGLTGLTGLAVIAVAGMIAVIGAMPAAATPPPPVKNAAAMPAFYTVPSPLPAGNPGDLIASEDLGPVPGGERWRVMYHSRSIRGDDIAVTGLVFIPSVPAPVAGRPILAWSHGTTGAADICAPSLGGYDPEFLDDWLAQGYVVAATDYEGMGTPGIHPYLLGESEGRGVLDSVRAARLLPGTSTRADVVLFGHSQGGHAAVFANELAPAYAPELRVVATIAAAPASQLVFAFTLTDLGAVVRSAAIMMAAGMAAQYGLDLRDILTDEAIRRIGVVDTGCQAEVEAAYADLRGPQIVKASPGEVPGWREAFLATEPGFRLGASPVLMYQGTADEEVPYIAGQILDARLCATGVAHIFTTYPGANHGGVLTLARQQTLDFAAARLRGEAVAPTACPALAADTIPTVTASTAQPVTITPTFTG